MIIKWRQTTKIDKHLAVRWISLTNQQDCVLIWPLRHHRASAFIYMYRLTRSKYLDGSSTRAEVVGVWSINKNHQKTCRLAYCVAERIIIHAINGNVWHTKWEEWCKAQIICPLDYWNAILFSDGSFDAKCGNILCGGCWLHVQNAWVLTRRICKCVCKFVVFVNHKTHPIYYNNNFASRSFGAK